MMEKHLAALAGLELFLLMLVHLIVSLAYLELIRTDLDKRIVFLVLMVLFLVITRWFLVRHVLLEPE